LFGEPCLPFDGYLEEVRDAGDKGLPGSAVEDKSLLIKPMFTPQEFLSGK